MKVRESLVYDKYTAQVVGFTKIGDLSDVEHPVIANHILGSWSEVCSIVCDSHMLTFLQLTLLVQSCI